MRHNGQTNNPVSKRGDVKKVGVRGAIPRLPLAFPDSQVGKAWDFDSHTRRFESCSGNQANPVPKKKGRKNRGRKLKTLVLGIDD